MRCFVFLALYLISFAVFLYPEAQTLVIVSPHWDGIKKEFSDSFQKHFKKQTGTEINIRWRDIGGTSQIEKTINALYSKNPNTCGFDIFWGGGMDPYENQKQRGQLLSYFPNQEILSEIPHEFRGVLLKDPEGCYYATALSTFGILENREIAKIRKLPQVQDWEDLVQPDFLGNLAMTDPRKSGSAHVIYEVILQAYGWEKGWRIIMKLAANSKTFTQNSSTATKAVSQGEVSHAVCIDLNALALQSVLGEQRVRFILPPNHSIIVPDGIGIFKGAPHQDAAQKFIDFVLSQEGQLLWTRSIGEPGGPTRFGITRIPVLPKLQKETSLFAGIETDLFKETSSFTYNAPLSSMRWTALNELIGRTLIDLHSRLQESWRNTLLLSPDKSSEIENELFSPWIHEDELNEAIALWKSNRLNAERLGEEWSKTANKRYQSTIQKVNDLRSIRGRQ